LKEALEQYGPPEVFDSEQGSQFTSTDFTDVQKDAKVTISMDGRGRWIESRMIEWPWRSLKYECVYLDAFETGSATRNGIGAGVRYFNKTRPHSSYGLLTTADAYATRKPDLKLAA
jgi:putative transposase